MLLVRAPNTGACLDLIKLIASVDTSDAARVRLVRRLVRSEKTALSFEKP